MNESKDLIKRVQGEIIDGMPTGNLYIGVTQDEYKQLEKDLEEYEYLEQSNEELQKLNTNYGKRIFKLEEILDIIIKKEVNIHNFKNMLLFDNVKTFDVYLKYYEVTEKYTSGSLLTETEFNKIKDWLQNE